MGKRLENLENRRKKRKKGVLIALSIFVLFFGAIFIYFQSGLKIFTPESEEITKKTDEMDTSDRENPSPNNPIKPIPEEEVSVTGPKELTIIAVGDILLDRQVGAMIKEHGIDEPFLDVVDILSSADITVANLECPLSTRGTKADKEYTFR